ncbi:hypothetical protein AG0111_0g1629 [Alternaria gaisen]|uniref:Uncharacterized protein n=1 Tax=Alternaria gaisen TaxID=167740 RepID=A0ACB6G530_9PLEO|nr:hypothetical protein AG0111_0g1629 [Alternaria gaisen]
MKPSDISAGLYTVIVSAAQQAPALFQVLDKM